jgi:Flp pilus assembly secretin CpaC
MRRLTLALTAISSLSAAAAHGQALSIPAGQTARLSLSAPVRDIIIGDPLVADVSVINKRTLVVMGKKAGSTSISAFAANGRPLLDRKVMVSSGLDGAVTVSRGAVTSVYACGDRCAKLDAGAAVGPIDAPAQP